MMRSVWTRIVKLLAALDTARFFAERRKRADFDAFDRIMGRTGGEPPQVGDELPE